MKIARRYKDFSEKEKTRRSAYGKSYRASHKKEVRSRLLERRYGISQEAVDALLKKQNNVCAICKTSKWGYNAPSVDHDHGTGKIRGILCRRCNLVLGLINDSRLLSMKILYYLASHQLRGFNVGKD